MFDKLNEMFPGASFYEVVGMTHSDAIELCARLSVDRDHLIEINGKVVYIVPESIGTSVDFLSPILDPNAPVTPVKSASSVSE